MVERDLKYDQSERIGFMKIDETDFKSMTLAEKNRHLELEGYVVLPDILDSISIEKIKQEKNIKYGFPIDEIPLKIRTANTPSEIIIG